jgi:hypothetical protein
MKTIQAYPVKNATKPLVLAILPSDIEQATRKDPATCAIACAARRSFGTDEVRIHLSRIYVRVGKEWRRYMTPDSLRSEIIAFDRGGSFSPGEHWLATPPPAKRTGKRQGSDTASSGGRGKKRRAYHYTDDVRPPAPHAGVAG